MSYLVDNSYSVKNVSDLVTFVAPGSIVNGAIGLTWLDDGQYVEISGEEFTLTFHNFRKPFTYFKLIYKCETSGVLSFKDSLGNAYGETLALTGDPAWQTIDRDNFTGWDIQGSDVVITFSGLTSNLFVDYVVFVANVSGTVGLNGTSGTDGAAGANGVSGIDGTTIKKGNFPDDAFTSTVWTYAGDPPTLTDGVCISTTPGGTQYYTPNVNQQLLKVYDNVNYKLRFTLSTDSDNADLRVAFVDPTNGFVRNGYSTDANAIVVGDAGNSGPGNADWYITGMTTAQVFEQNVVFTGLTVASNLSLFFYYGGEFIGTVFLSDVHLDAIGLQGPAGADGGSLDTTILDNSMLLKDASGVATGRTDYYLTAAGTIVLGPHTMGNPDYSVVAGYNNNVTGRWGLIAGYNNNVSVACAITAGRDNAISGNNGIALGSYSTISQGGSVTIGNKLVTQGHQIAIGYGNVVTGTTAYDDINNPVVVIGAGIGTDENNCTAPKNAVIVRHSGDVEFSDRVILKDVVNGNQYALVMSGGTFTTYAL